MNVEIIRSQRLYDGFLNLDLAHLRHELADGEMSPEMTRLNVERGDGAAVLLLNRDTQCVVLTRQFRYANWKRGDGGLIIEIPAGTVPRGADPETVARKEVTEEVGYHAEDLRLLAKFYASPGTSTERVFLYYAEVGTRDRVSDGGGLAHETEFIEVIEMPIAHALEQASSGAFTDAKTIIALQLLPQLTATD